MPQTIHTFFYEIMFFSKKKNEKKKNYGQKHMTNQLFSVSS